MGEAGDLWNAKVGHIAYPRVGKALKPLVDQYGWPRVHVALVEYITATRGTRKLEWFRDGFVSYDEMANDPLSDEYGLTPRGLRVWHDLPGR